MTVAALRVDGRRHRLQVTVADRFLSRARGFLWRSPNDAPDAVLLARCRAIHTLGMSVPIDAVFMDEAGRVLRAVTAVRPWRAAGCRYAHSVLELRTGLICALGIRVGGRVALEFEP